MLIRVHREAVPGERRVALTPRAVATLVAAGHSVTVPSGAGSSAGFPDGDYESAGATVFTETVPKADLLVGVGPLTADDVVAADAVIGFLDPLGNPAGAAAIAATGVTAFSLDMLPRTTLAQSMDALSSQAAVAGYQSVLLAASELPRFFPMLMTAAGTIRPSRVLVLGAGVAGLQAVATAKRLGAVVLAYDIRAAAREQVESLGATFVGGPVSDEPGSGGYAGEVDEATRAAQQVALAEAVASADVVICTAAVPGRRAPILLTAEMVEAMRPGSIVIDAAAATGGNCTLTEPGQWVDHGGVRVYGPLDLASRTPGDASEMFAKNIVSLVSHLAKEGAIAIADDDPIGTEACVTRGGAIVSARVGDALAGGRS